MLFLFFKEVFPWKKKKLKLKNYGNSICKRWYAKRVLAFTCLNIILKYCFQQCTWGRWYWCSKFIIYQKCSRFPRKRSSFSLKFNCRKVETLEVCGTAISSEKRRLRQRHPLEYVRACDWALVWSDRWGPWGWETRACFTIIELLLWWPPKIVSYSVIRLASLFAVIIWKSCLKYFRLRYSCSYH